MRNLGYIVAAMFFGGAASAEPAIDLLPTEVHNDVKVVSTDNYTGTCGKAVVRVLGVTGVSKNVYTVELDTAKIIVRIWAEKEQLLKELVLDGGVLSDFNGVACVQTKSGSRLLIWSTCSGSACGYDLAFSVVDPDRAVLLAPKRPESQRCDEKCASRILGNDTPQKISRSYKAYP